MTLQLQRPIAFFDIESTGTDRDTDRIVEIAVCKLLPDMSRESRVRRVNPEIPIPKEASDVHGITDEMVADQPKFKEIAKGLMLFLDGCDIGGFNSNAFDIPMLFNEFHRAGLFWDYKKFVAVDAGNLFKIQHPRTLTAAVKTYLGRELENAHSAQADIEATVDVFLAQVEHGQYEEGFPKTLEELALYTNYGNQVVDLSGKFTLDVNDEVVINFGAHKGKLAKDNLSFLDWMVNKANFSEDTRRVAISILYPDSYQ